MLTRDVEHGRKANLPAQIAPHSCRGRQWYIRSLFKKGGDLSSLSAHGNGDVVLADAVAEEVEALLAATEKAAETIRHETEREALAALDELSELVAGLRGAADRLERQLDTARAQLGVATAPALNGTDIVRRARLVALNMAANGAPREETDRYLAERLGISDRTKLLDAAYDSSR